jgi:hypothetical protein
MADGLNEAAEEACRSLAKIQVKDVEGGGPLLRQARTQDEQGYGVALSGHALSDCEALPFCAADAE